MGCLSNITQHERKENNATTSAGRGLCPGTHYFRYLAECDCQASARLLATTRQRSGNTTVVSVTATRLLAPFAWDLSWQPLGWMVAYIDRIPKYKLTHWGQKMANCFYATFLFSVSCLNYTIFRSKYHWNIFSRVKLGIYPSLDHAFTEK